MGYIITILNEDKFNDLNNTLINTDDYDISNIIYNDNYDHYEIDEYTLNIKDTSYITNVLKPTNKLTENISDKEIFFKFQKTYFIIYDNGINNNIFFKVEDNTGKKIVDDDGNTITPIKVVNGEEVTTITFDTIYKVREHSYKNIDGTDKYSVYIYEISFFEGESFIKNAEKNHTFSNVTFYYGQQKIFNIHINNDMYYYNISHLSDDGMLYIKFDLDISGAALYSILQRIFRPEDDDTEIINSFTNLYRFFKENKYYILNINDNKYLINNEFEDDYNIYDFIYLIVDNIISHMSNEELINLLNDSVIITDATASSITKRYSSFFWQNIKKLFNSTEISPAITNKKENFYNGYYDMTFYSSDMQENNVLYNLEDEITIKDTTTQTLNDYNLYINNTEYHSKRCLTLYKKYIKKYMVSGDDEKINYMFNKYTVNYTYNLIDIYKKQYNVTYTLNLK